jgi:hypothetical protein
MMLANEELSFAPKSIKDICWKKKGVMRIRKMKLTN